MVLTLLSATSPPPEAANNFQVKYNLFIFTKHSSNTVGIIFPPFPQMTLVASQ